MSEGNIAEDAEENWDVEPGFSPVRYGFLALAAVIIGFSVFNASWLAGKQPGRLMLVADGGIRQAAASDASGDCASAQIAATQPHNFIENTIAGINFAYSRRAGYVEVDVRPTADGRLVLFSEEQVDCRTNGEGAVSDLTLEELQQLDVGYALTPDGTDFPVRGRGVGRLPSLEQVVTLSNDQAIVFNFVEDDPAQAAMLAGEYERAEREMGNGVIIMGSSELLAAIGERFPQAALLDVNAAEACFDAYMWSGWYGGVPDMCEGDFISVPLDRQWMIWGWPNRFIARMQAADVIPFVVATHDGDGAVPLTRLDQISDVPRDFRGLLFLSDIQQMGPALRP